uniref:Uncharacterized protein n=1 Tax=Aureoumbra lagunensis TaxID=44058 RepID=A0A7S3JSK6_9STRA|mmetsp:Transcript_4019/g.5645  ORF Transcript_4019/g.5645 Transcript_4019/m.5645 type:complete len:202 (+) Transcript_4019:30-635(+)
MSGEDDDEKRQVVLNLENKEDDAANESDYESFDEDESQDADEPDDESFVEEDSQAEQKFWRKIWEEENQDELENVDVHPCHRSTISGGKPMTGDEYKQMNAELIAAHDQKNQAYEEALAEYSANLDPSLQDGFKLQHDFFKKITGGYSLLPPPGPTLTAMLNRNMAASLERAQAGEPPPGGYFSEHLKAHIETLKRKHSDI